MSIRNGGWQVNVVYFDDYVIKTPKSIDEINRKVSRHLSSKNELYKLQDTVDRIQLDWQTSIEMIKNSNIPLKYLAYPEFLENETIKQRKAEILRDRLQELIDNDNYEDVKILAERFCKFIYLLWSYGFNEKTYKITTEFGILDNEIILIDFGELSNKKEKVTKQIKEKSWSGLKYLPRHLNEKVEKIFREVLEEMLTLERLEEYWGVNVI